MTKQFWAVIVVIVLALIGVFVVTSHKSNTSGSSSTSSSTATQHIEGSATTGVKLVEYGDYECPYCEEYSTVVAQIAQQYSSQISFQFRNFPLTSIHPNAFAGARAAEAAGLEGKFWQMHDTLYLASNWEQWSTASNPNPYFYQYAAQLGLNVTTFKTDFASTKVNNLINADESVGNKLGIDGTPTFYLDGKQLQVADNVADFQKAINAAIASKASGTTSTTTTSGTTTQTTK